VHKDSTYATILNSEGKIINQMRMNNEKVPSYLSHYKVSKVAMEASTFAASLYRQLVSQGFKVVVSILRKRASLRRLGLKATELTPRLLLNWRGWMRCHWHTYQAELSWSGNALNKSGVPKINLSINLLIFKLRVIVDYV